MTDCRRAYGVLLSIILSGLLMTGCHAARRPTAAQATVDANQPAGAATQAYAGAVLGHMMAVVTGAAGQVDNRSQWRTRGMDIPLRFSLIQKGMSDPEFDKSQLLVYDTEIMGLSRVLYHYDPRLNQFKGRQPFYSPFPSEELIALRLLLIGKIARGEMIRLSAVIDRLQLILDTAGHLSVHDTDAMGLTADETILLADVLRSEPVLADYFRHPAVAAALERMGILEASLPNRPPFPVPPLTAREPSTLALITVLPSFETAFASSVTGGREILIANDDYRKLTAYLKAEIITASGDIARDAYQQQHPGRRLPPSEKWREQWRAFTERRIVFFMPDTPPLAITPYNAKAVIGVVCPDADLNIILTGKDVVRSMDIRPERDFFPHTNRFFVDASDVKYQFVGDIIAQIGEWLVGKTGPAFYLELLGDAS